MKIVADNKIPFLKGALDDHCQMVYLPGRDISPDDVRDADALIIRTRTRCNKELLQGSTVRFIASATIGFDHIDTAYCGQKGIRWTNAPGCNAGAVQQYMASALAWIIQRKNKKFRDLTLGIIGAGHVGSRVEAMGRTLGIHVLVNDPPRQRMEGSEGFVGLEELLAASDIISLHVPLNMAGKDKTLHMAGESFFGKVKPGAWFINTARGEVSSTAAILGALDSGRLAGAVIDVWENEPAISAELLSRAAIATPHIAGYSTDGKANGTTMSVRAVSRYFKLGLDNWEPSSLPRPEPPQLTIDCDGLEPDALFRRLAMLTYPLENDSLALKHHLEGFERHREEYPVRREPQAYTMNLLNEGPDCRQVVKAMGFRP